MGITYVAHKLYPSSKNGRIGRCRAFTRSYL